MNDMRALLEQYIRAAWRRRWIGVAIAWAACLVGWAGVYAIPNKFESSARLYVDTDAILTPLLHGIAAQTAPQRQLELLRRTLLSSPNMDKLISKTNLDLTIHDQADRQRLIEQLQHSIKVHPQTKTLFTISYRSTKPKQAYNVVQTLLSIFVESATGSNRSDMNNARQFLKDQIASYEQQLRAAEQRRAAFRSRYIMVLPQAGSNVSAVDSTRQHLQQLEGQLQDVETTRALLRKELKSTPAMLSAAALAQKTSGTQLQKAEERLRMLLLKYTPDHPLVIAQKALIASLKAAPSTAGSAAGKSQGGSGSGPLVPNPVYDHLKVKLVDTDTQALSLKREVANTQTSLKRLEKILHEQPGLLAEYRNMDRDYGVLRGIYQNLLSRLQSANIAQAADTQADKVKILVVDPPQVPHLPVAPNRLLLISGVLVAALGAGVAAPILLGQFDNSFTTADDLRRLGLPVLGGISVLGLAPLRQRLTVVARLGLALVVLVALYGGLVFHLTHGGLPI